MIDELGFGDFKFRSPKGKVINRAKNINDLISKIKKVKSDSIKFHASKNHISNWLATRGEFKLSSIFREIRKNDFKNIDKRKEYYLDILSENINISAKTKIVEFSKKLMISPIILFKLDQAH